ncbi:sigma-70 family RNA polymerase sigma factor [Paenibacillus thiaminolyticus]|uniref:Sigma-70 family RNA polymerase sigma factor n=1 Tax=Paenibacillus thiaminolyticus TaxID=49283 RepID=A0ABT4FYZ6_PANTH|nr:sigma-70 family RNA polymerase sigma factor [Paenibacillus thiaminolyticus]MCY9539004.1 sigma-70 family RNA polymerase sigma factor [Paenibacillus thiaminolyticus]MCY9604210.1 sigma-70 family RNA polymerase sigma factor [Paenibacillus thiaminolyticus]MCY9608116.1 sigma-70 family RNA polymerase sigma factor [Paenibacillus thiaminolyticus]MCY9612954.1 sigma-70 family RNA polymerase sigma factor [Paenibacillus thiaminolyticus]MCY9621991.1 sigma-70 family RNA polymerase sigma factor [Paenibacil
MSTVLTDEELIEEIRGGSQAAMEVLVKRHYSDVYSYLYRKIGNRHTAYDLTQEVFIKMMQSLGNYRDKGRFRHWLLKIAVNHCYDYYRSKQYRHRHAHTELEVDMPDENSNVWDLFHCHYQQEQAKQAVLSLPEKQRDAIILNFYHDMKIREIAVMTDTSESTIKYRIKAGISKLKQILLAGGEGSDHRKQG